MGILYLVNVWCVSVYCGLVVCLLVPWFLLLVLVWLELTFVSGKGCFYMQLQGVPER